ncbi:hypothetical protein [Nostoc parmelioides]|nr:hypothetical protein [Nostoc parmelioides]
MPESAVAFPQIPRARSPNIKDGSGIDVTLRDATRVRLYFMGGDR